MNNPRRRVLLVIPTLDQSGAEKQFTLLAKGLVDEEFEVRVVALTRGGYFEEFLKDAGIPVTVLGKRWKFDPRAALRLRKIIREWQPMIVHSWLFAANAYVRLVAGRRRPPFVVVSERCVDSWKASWQSWLDRRQVSRTTRMVANSQSVAEFYVSAGFPRQHIEVIPNAVTVPDGDLDHNALRQSLDIPLDVKLVGYVGRLARQKRVTDLVWGMQLLQQLRDDVYFLIVGDGPDGFRIKDQLEQYDVRTRVRMTGHREDAASIVRLLDVFWLGSDFEGMSNSVMEAMSNAVPVVCTDIPANRELVVDGETGLVVQVGDSVGFSELTDRILADPEFQRRLGQAGQDRVRELFGVDQMVKRHVEMYRSILDAAATK